MLPRLFKIAVMIMLKAESQCRIFNNLALQVNFSFKSTRLISVAKFFGFIVNLLPEASLV
uniref:Uncharacterized protein n=1 Tax=Hyaloperonospora arabidopsidis (strain Emoy2) TaxID=559515 RepID=M4B9W6_HYAAE